MKKVININFQGRVVMIEETAYDHLKLYIESLRRHFANEEGHEEIINDIESRISELFEEVIKKGKPCVSEADLKAIIDSIGRPEDLEENPDDTAGTTARHLPTGTRQFFRDENNKKIGGVCAGIANYFGFDPTIVRLITIVLFCVYGIGLIPYIILWIAVPSSAAQVIGSSHKKLFRDISNRTIGGVCSGLASYFNVSIWVPKVIFIFGAFCTFPLSIIFNRHFGGILFPGINGFFLMLYIILWIVVPPALTSSEKLSMKGENVDLHNIKSTVQEDLNDGRKKITPMKSEPVMLTPNNRSTLGDFIIIICKIFAYFVLGMILISILAGLFTAGMALFTISPVKEYIISGFWQNLFATAAVILLIWLPILGIIVWIIRRLTKSREGSKTLRISFVSLWLVGLIAGIALAISLYRDFRYINNPVVQAIPVPQPKPEKLEVNLINKTQPFRNRTPWFINRNITAFLGDSVSLNNVRISLRPATADSFTVAAIKFANGNSVAGANENAARINMLPLYQQDSALNIPGYFTIDKNNKFRNQFIVVSIGVPVGKKIEIHNARGYKNRFYLDLGVQNDFDFGFNSGWQGDDGDLNWSYNTEYIMTKEGLQRTHLAIDDRRDRIESAEEIIKEQQEKIKAQQAALKQELKEQQEKIKQDIKEQQEQLEKQLKAQ